MSARFPTLPSQGNVDFIVNNPQRFIAASLRIMFSSGEVGEIAASHRNDRAAFGLRGKAKSSGNNVLVPSRGRAGLPSAIELRLVSPVFDPFFGAAN
jgi:hypothetical protein